LAAVQAALQATIDANSLQGVRVANFILASFFTVAPQQLKANKPDRV
jgi:hypothetical protein